MTNLASNLLAAAVYSVLGIVLFVATFILIDKLTPGSLWKEIIEEHNVALAVMVSGLALSVALVIGAAIL